ncbi:SusC/RagA family TonB-linked outer membrane protein [Sphingobacterium corticibacter]|uniref:SusC/RagA family TonB-linked outer membrane protein n=1 Tax=Sphingobacterium corticibacter TaxID=2171749 RepID=A0A2T8HLP9_9SPHI|nr:TonB-dependent receptor [Sphingobacterium corticibacter]PVH26364.1 SusC/RagA family TonB-linked outer membrane protein [Sphingobacterium corticibacter]
MKKQLLSFFVLCLLSIGIASAQNRTVTGNVTASAERSPLSGVSVTIVGTSSGTQTDDLGNYSISVPANATLRFSYVGFNSKNVVVGTQSTINVGLDNESSLDEVVVVGYGTQLKRNLTTSISTVGAAELKDIPVPNIQQVLQGKTAGVMVTSGGGRPGAPLAVQIRGRSSINAGNNPLYVIDGVIMASNNDFTPNAVGAGISPLANLNSEDIVSVEVLKDAAAASIYGSRGSNGVVIITTKGGNKSGKSQIAASTYTGWQSLTKKRDLLNSTEYRTLYNEAATNAGLAPVFTQDQVANPENNVNWLDEILADESNVTSAQVSVTSGGNENTQFYTSFNYFNQDGMLQRGGFERYAVRANLTHRINDFITLGSNTALTRSMRDETPVDNSIFSPFPRALVARPDQPIYNADGTFATNSYNNPLHMFQSQNFVNLANVFNSSYLQFDIVSGLKFKTAVGIDYSFLDQRIYNPITSLSGMGSNGSAASGTAQTRNFLATQTLSYDKSFYDNRLDLNAIAVYEYQRNQRENNRVDGNNFPSDLTPYLTSAAAITGGTANFTEFSLASALARVNLGWDGKYLFSASIRRDGSSKFPESGRFGYFPSVSAGWVMSEENFLKNVDAISLLKVRASYGSTGNQEGIGNFAFRRTIGGGFNYFDLPGFGLSAIGSPNLKWETTNQVDVGIDLGLFNNRLEIAADYYNKTTKDLLLNRPIPSTTGFSTILENIGNIKGSGFDFQVTSRNFRNADFTWSTSLNISTYRNEVTKLFNDQPIDQGFVVRHAVGQPLGSFFLIKSLGVDPETGDMMYEDFDGSGTITSADRQFMGNPLPKFHGGFTNNFSYKNFDLDVFFQYSYGNDIYNLGAEGTGGYGSMGAVVSGTAPATNMFRDYYLDRWTPENTNAEQPRAVGGVRGTFNSQRSSRFLEDGSYLRLKTLTLGYNLPKSLIQNARFTNVRIYASAYNLLTFTKYTGFDPEVSSELTVSNLGVDQGSIPQFRTFMLGINLGL